MKHNQIRNYDDDMLFALGLTGGDKITKLVIPSSHGPWYSDTIEYIFTNGDKEQIQQCQKDIYYLYGDHRYIS